MYGPVRTVVWQGSAGNRCPYADQIPNALIDDNSRRILNLHRILPDPSDNLFLF